MRRKNRTHLALGLMLMAVIAGTCTVVYQSGSKNVPNEKEFVLNEGDSIDEAMKTEEKETTEENRNSETQNPESKDPETQDVNTSLQYLYLLENVGFTPFLAIYLLIYSIFTPNLSQYFQFGYFFFFLFF